MHEIRESTRDELGQRANGMMSHKHLTLKTKLHKKILRPSPLSGIIKTKMIIVQVVNFFCDSRKNLKNYKKLEATKYHAIWHSRFMHACMPILVSGLVSRNDCSTMQSIKLRLACSDKRCFDIIVIFGSRIQQQNKTIRLHKSTSGHVNINSTITLTLTFTIRTGPKSLN